MNVDYHVEFNGHYYSVPIRLVGAKLDVRVTGPLLECFCANQLRISANVTGDFGSVTASEPMLCCAGQIV